MVDCSLWSYGRFYGGAGGRTRSCSLAIWWWDGACIWSRSFRKKSLLSCWICFSLDSPSRSNMKKPVSRTSAKEHKELSHVMGCAWWLPSECATDETCCTIPDRFNAADAFKVVMKSSFCNTVDTLIACAKHSASCGCIHLKNQCIRQSPGRISLHVFEILVKFEPCVFSAQSVHYCRHQQIHVSVPALLLPYVQWQWRPKEHVSRIWKPKL